MPGLDDVPWTRPNFSKISSWSSGAIPLAVVVDRDRDAPVRRASPRTSTGAPGGRVLDRVVDQVREHLPQPAAVAVARAAARAATSCDDDRSPPLAIAAATASSTSSPRSTSANDVA